MRRRHRRRSELGYLIEQRVGQAVKAVPFKRAVEFVYQGDGLRQHLRAQSGGHGVKYAPEKLLRIVLKRGEQSVQRLGLFLHRPVILSALAGGMAHGFRDLVHGHLALADAVV